MKGLEHLFVPYELAVKLKEKGFNEPCIAFVNLTMYILPEQKDRIKLDFSVCGKFAYYNDHKHILAFPLYQQVVDWFREKYIDIDVVRNYDGWRYCITEFKSGNKVIKASGNETEDYYQELKTAVEYALTLI